MTFSRHPKAATRLGALALTAATFLIAVSPAMAAEAKTPQWTIAATSTPTNIDPAAKPGEDTYTVLLTNTGSGPAGCTAAQYKIERDKIEEGKSAVAPVCPKDSPPTVPPITITDELPQGLSLDPAGASGENTLAKYQGIPPGAGFSCALTTCTYTPVVVPDQTLAITFPLDVSALEGEALTNTIRVAGGGAKAASASAPTAISSQPAGFGFAPGSTTAAFSSLQAGSHPDITNTFAFNSANAVGTLSADPKDVVYHLPPGFASDFAETPACSAAQLLEVNCPIASQVGVTTVTILFQGSPKREIEPVYNLTPDPGHLAALAFSVGGEFFVQGQISLQPRRYGAEVSFANIDDAITEVLSGSLTVWGVPAASIHDPLRAVQGGGGVYSLGHPSAANPTPYFTNPTSCGIEPLTSSFSSDSWQQPGVPVEATMPYGPIVGCDRLTIEPTLEAQPSSSSAETATGLAVNLESPQHFENFEGLVASHLRDTKVTLPEGMSLNPSAGSGLGSCTEAQLEYEELHFEPQAGQGCPNESKVGSIKIHSPALSEEATGSLYVAKPFENPFDSLLALYLVARIPDRGVVVASAGKVSPDPLTGQLTTTFEQAPQLPFDHLTLKFKQGATSPLVTPPTCGHFVTDAVLTPWSVPSQEHFLTSPFDITSGVGGGACPSGATPPFHPGLAAGAYRDDAGGYSPFYIELSRNDGEQEFTHFSIKLPPGVSGKLAGIPECSDAAILQAKSREHDQGGAEEEANPSCPAASEVGHTLVEAGVGSVLAQAPGHVYLAGPYHGAPISVVAITAAKVGPFDLGTVVVREALKVNPETAEVFVDATGSDPLPHIVSGIPTHLRNIRIYMDRPEFVLNPTSCEPTSTASTVLGSGKDFVSEADDQPVTVTSPFQVANCAALPFGPQLGLKLLGATKRTGHPALKATLQMNGVGEAAISRAQVTLPKSEFLDQGHLNNICTRVQFKEGAGNGANCPAASIYGHARAVTPILSEPLEGPVYLRSSEHKLPDLVAALHGQEINIDLVGRIDSFHGPIRTTFEAVPDAPVESFTLEMQGGSKGLLINSTNLCQGKHRAIVDFTGHNGKISDSTPAVGARCPKHHKGKHGHRRRGARR